MDQRERLEFLIGWLLDESPEYRGLAVPDGDEARRMLFRGLVNVRPPKAAAPEFLEVQDAYLREEIAAKGVTDADALEPVRDGVCVWRGDIATLRCDAVVNAANSGMTGCYVPNHACIDNCIHTFAGVQLRLECDGLMRAQGAPEETGRAKITSAWNLPSRHVIHTVGPIVQGEMPTDMDRALLERCYVSCLELAGAHGLKSVAFCCISTGVFRYPAEEAAEVAVRTVLDRKDRCGVDRVVFNVFSERDLEIYGRILHR